MTSHRLLARLVALGIMIGACTPLENADNGKPLPGTGGASATGGTRAASGGDSGSGTGGVPGTGGSVTGTGGAPSGTGGFANAGGQTGSGGAVGTGGRGTGGAGAGMATGGAGGQSAGGISAGCAAGLGLCDDFESYADGMVPDGRWMMVKAFSTGASLMVDGTKASSGSKALHIKATFTNGGGSANIATKPGDAAFTGITNAGFLRFMMFQTAFTQPGPTHGRMVRVGNAMATAGSNGTGYAFSLHYQKPAQLKVEQMNDVYFGATAPVLDKWVCWEIQYGPGMLNWWMDGTKVTTPTNFPATTMLSMMEIGFETFTPITIEFWLDDVAFNSKRIGCPAK